jgi:hypothetical protein
LKERATGLSWAACRDGIELGSVSRGAPIQFGDWNIVVAGEPGVLTMHRQLLTGLEYMEARWVFLCENDVLYHPSHFEFEPRRTNLFYYNTNVWKVRYPDGHCVWTDDLQQVSGVCAARSLLLSFYRARVAKIEANGFDRHYEPGPKTGPYETENWAAAFPSLDIRHSKTMTKSKWKPQDFRNQRYARGWKEASAVPGWGQIEGRFGQMLDELLMGADNATA